MYSKIQKLKQRLNEFNLSENRILKSLKKYNYRPKTEYELSEILKLKSDNKDPDLNDIDVSNLEQLVSFYNFDFFISANFYLDEWDVSNVFDFSNCFYYCVKFNSDLSNWDTSNGVKFRRMFDSSYTFNQSVKNFDLKNAEDVEYFFSHCLFFNNEVFIDVFNPKVKSIAFFFYDCHRFNKDVSMWDVSNVQNFESVFGFCKNFKQDLSSWNVSNATFWRGIFGGGAKISKYPELLPKKFRWDVQK